MRQQTHTFSYEANLTEFIEPSDPRAKEERFTAAKREELQGMMENGTSEIVCKSEVQEGTKVLRGQFFSL